MTRHEPILNGSSKNMRVKNNTMTTQFYLDAALALSPGNKAIVELLNHQVCIVHLIYHHLDNYYFATVLDMDSGNIIGFYGDFNSQALDNLFDKYPLMTEQGISISVAKRLWTPLEWWQHPTD